VPQARSNPSGSHRSRTTPAPRSALPAPRWSRRRRGPSWTGRSTAGQCLTPPDRRRVRICPPLMSAAGPGPHPARERRADRGPARAAELGPRALGNRSILAAAVDPRMKDLLNGLKRAKSYRRLVAGLVWRALLAGLLSRRQGPVHAVRSPRTARLESASRPSAPRRVGAAADRLVRREPIPGRSAGRVRALERIPVLCNTSANFNGSGFFPDVCRPALGCLSTRVEQRDAVGA